jgi:hypothetical protein
MGKIELTNIHFYQLDNLQIDRHLIFGIIYSPILTDLPGISHLEEELPKKYQNTNEYSPAKKEFVKEMENRALLWLECRN